MAQVTEQETEGFFKDLSPALSIDLKVFINLLVLLLFKNMPHLNYWWLQLMYFTCVLCRSFCTK